MTTRRPGRTQVMKMTLLLLTRLITVVDAVAAIVVIALFRGMAKCVMTCVAAN